MKRPADKKINNLITLPISRKNEEYKDMYRYIQKYD